MKIALDLVRIETTRMRATEPAQVEALSQSISEVGLLNPITVYPRKLYDGRILIDGYGLVAGLHRLTAARALGWSEIDANVVTLDDLERQIAECDENLVGPHLSASDRARFIKRRKDAYEALHPETRREATLRQGDGAPSRQVGETGKPQRFSANTASATGISERAIQRDAERGEKVIGEAIDLVRGTPLDTGAYLDKLKKLSPNDQVKAAKRDLTGARKDAREADAKDKAKTKFKHQLDSLTGAWDRSGEDVRTAFKRKVGLVAIVKPTKAIAGMNSERRH
jgi:ParB family chromosome partitioning protein